MAASWLMRLVLTACLAALGGCSDSSQNPAAPGPAAAAPGIMSATVSGMAWGAGGVSGSPAAASYTPSGGSASIYVVGHRIYSDGSGSYIAILVHLFAGVGTYPLSLETSATSGARASFVTYTATNDTTTYATDASHTGSITVTLFDVVKRDIKGTFVFTGYHASSATAANVTTGSFDVSF